MSYFNAKITKMYPEISPHLSRYQLLAKECAQVLFNYLETKPAQKKYG